nr:MAG TPA: hypothetical protein [Caudoviricetes sp.]
MRFLVVESLLRLSLHTRLNRRRERVSRRPWLPVCVMKSGASCGNGGLWAAPCFLLRSDSLEASQAQDQACLEG